jgi:aspartyl-tRNA(Asn)/glutamyl-tRNA(Gln) amidotransferase subunit C
MSTTHIELQEIEKLAKLSRIELTDEEKVAMQNDISSILGYVEQIKGVTTSSDVSSRIAQSHTPRNVFRDDTSEHPSGAYTKAIVGNFPRKEGDYLKVKKIL